MMSNKRMYEVFFKGHHVMHFPWGVNDEKVTAPRDKTVPFQNKVIRVDQLCHVTHSKEADEIEQDDCFAMKILTIVSSQKTKSFFLDTTHGGQLIAVAFQPKIMIR